MHELSFGNSITAIIKTSNACNIRCRYCYNSSDNYSNDKLTIEQIKIIFEKITDYYNNIRIIWHGGEPLLMGMDFYKQAIEMQHSIEQKKHAVFSNAMQTNATLIDDEWCKFFSNNSVKIGVSFDGPPFGLSGRPHWELALSGMSLLDKNNIKFGTIAVINGGNIDFLNEIYDYSIGMQHNVNLSCAFRQGQMINPLNQEYGINPDKYVNKMILLFYRWIYDSRCNIIVNPFFDIVRTITDRPHSCEHTSCLYKFISIDHHGNVFPCGRFDSDNTCMGNIFEPIVVPELFESDNYKELVRGAINRRNKCKQTCQLYKYCAGGCNFSANLAGNINNNCFPECSVYKKMFICIKDTIDNLDYSKREMINKTVTRLLNKRTNNGA